MKGSLLARFHEAGASALLTRKQSGRIRGFSKKFQIASRNACDTPAEYGLRGSKEGGGVRYYCKSHGPTKGCFQIDQDRAAWVQAREKARRKASPACPERERHQKGPGSRTAPQSWTATAESVCADRGARHNPRTVPRAIASDSKSDCGRGAACHPHAASDDAQPGQPLVLRRAEGLCALSSGSTRFGVQPAATVSVLARSGFQGLSAYEYGSEKVFYSSAPKSRALIATQLMIGGVESNPGWPTHDPGALSSSRRRPLIHLPTAEQSNPNWVAEVMARSAVQPAQPQWQAPPTAPSVSRV
ncbi:hypothetical protein KFL_011840010, partial [Klebsormidium nitens]